MMGGRDSIAADLLSFVLALSLLVSWCLGWAFEVEVEVAAEVDAGGVAYTGRWGWKKDRMEGCTSEGGLAG